MKGWRDDAPPLRPYQVAAVEWLARRGSYGLFDEMRLGKTATLLRDFCAVREYRPDARLLIVAPNNVIYNAWQPEVAKWTTLSCEVASGTARQRRLAIESGADVTVIAYDNIDRELAALNDQRFYYLGFDEAHAIKGYKSLRTRAAHALRGAKRGMVTATPMLNRVDELWSLMFMIAPTEFPTYWSFVTRYAVFGGYENRQIVGIQNAADLRARMAPFCLRRLRSEVMDDLPNPEPVDVWVELNPDQRRLYNTALNELKIEIENRPVDEFANPMVRTLKLREITATPECVGGPDDSAILDRCVEDVVGTDPARKIVVFSTFVPPLRAMARRLDAAGVANASIMGGGSAQSRAETITRWATSPSARVLLVSYGVGREGIDLSAADLGLCLDTLYVPALQLQAESRLVNVARKQTPEIIHYQAKNTVSARVMAILKEKQASFDTVMSGDELERKLAAVVTLEELLA